MQINREKLFRLYMADINAISEELEDKSGFEPEEIVEIICNILESHPDIINNSNLIN